MSRYRIPLSALPQPTAPVALPPPEMLDPARPGGVFDNYGYGAPRLVTNDTGMQVIDQGVMPVAGGAGGLGQFDQLGQFLARPESFNLPVSRAPVTTPNLGGTITRNRPGVPEALMVAPSAAGGGSTAQPAATPEIARQLLAADRAEMSLPINPTMDRPSQGEPLPQSPEARSEGFANEAVRRYLAAVRRGDSSMGLEDFLKGAQNVRETAAAALPPPQPQLGEVLDIQGTPFVRTNPKQITALRDQAPGPQSGLAKLQADLRRAESEGRAEDAEILRREITQQTDTSEKPFSVREFQSQPDLMKQYGMSYGKYLADFNRLRTEGGAGAPSAPASAAAPGAPVRVTSKAERDKLPPGTRYVGPDGRTYTKK